MNDCRVDDSDAVVSTSVTNQENPLYVRKEDVSDAEHKFSQPYEKDILTFLRMVEKETYLYSLVVSYLQGIQLTFLVELPISERIII